MRVMLSHQPSFNYSLSCWIGTLVSRSGISSQQPVFFSEDRPPTSTSRGESTISLVLVPLISSPQTCSVNPRYSGNGARGYFCFCFPIPSIDPMPFYSKMVISWYRRCACCYRFTTSFIQNCTCEHVAGIVSRSNAQFQCQYKMMLGANRPVMGENRPPQSRWLIHTLNWWHTVQITWQTVTNFVRARIVRFTGFRRIIGGWGFLTICLKMKSLFIDIFRSLWSIAIYRWLLCYSMLICLCR